MTVGFIGLGRMGGGMAANLVRAGHRVVVCDHSTEAIERIVQMGAEPATDAAAVAAASDTLFVSLPGPPQIESVFYQDGVLEALRPGACVFDLSTNSLEMVRRLHADLTSRDVTFFDSPVSGGPAGAESGNLVLWIGGDAEAFAVQLPLLQSFSSSAQLLGEVTSGTAMKLTNNIIGQLILRSLAEGLSLGLKAGLDRRTMWDALSKGLVGRQSPLALLGEDFVAGTYDPNVFALRLAHKDAVLALSMASDLDVPMSFAEFTLSDLGASMERGLGDEDYRYFLDRQFERAEAGTTVQQA